MIRQARSYLVGAVSGTTLIAAAVVVFVVLVSVQAVRDWPLAGLAGSGDDSAAEVRVSPGRPAAAPSAGGLSASESAAGATAAAANGAKGDARSGNGGAGAAAPPFPD